MGMYLERPAPKRRLRPTMIGWALIGFLGSLAVSPLTYGGWW